VDKKAANQMEQAEARPERARKQAEATARKPTRALALVVFSLTSKTSVFPAPYSRLPGFNIP
jgi:hypothetical protein